MIHEGYQKIQLNTKTILLEVIKLQIGLLSDASDKSKSTMHSTALVGLILLVNI